jgi:hypothetical protein
VTARPEDLSVDGPGGSAASVEGRDVVIDVIRVLSLGVVIALHGVYVRLTLVEGTLVAQTAIGGPVIAALTWLLQVMPLFFLAAGFANTRMVDRCRREGTPVPAAQGPRLRRMLSPLALLLLVMLATALAVAWSDPAAALVVGAEAGSHLWFATAYLLCLAVAPVMVDLHDRYGLRVPAVLVGGSVLVDILRFGDVIDADLARFPGFVLVWLACHQLGILYARGVLRYRATHQVLGVGALAVLALMMMVRVGPYPPVTIGLSDAPESNLAPPTAVLALLAVAQFTVVTLVGRAAEQWETPPRLTRALHRLGSQMMLVYLWHVPVLGAVALLGLLAPDLLLPDDAATWWAQRPLWLGVSALVLWPVVRAASAWEGHLSRVAVRGDQRTVMVASVLGVAGAATVWRVGVTPTAVSIAACGAVVAALLLLVRSDRQHAER